MKLERDDEIGLTIHSESEATVSQRRYWTGIPKRKTNAQLEKSQGDRCGMKWKAMDRDEDAGPEKICKWPIPSNRVRKAVMMINGKCTCAE